MALWLFDIIVAIATTLEIIIFCCGKKKKNWTYLSVMNTDTQTHTDR